MGKQSSYRSEGELKKAFRKAFKSRILFVEHRYGGTAGISDCILLFGNNRTIFVELKANAQSEVRPSQKQFMRRCIKRGHDVLIAWWEGKSVRICRTGIVNGRLRYTHTFLCSPLDLKELVSDEILPFQ